MLTNIAKCMKCQRTGHYTPQCPGFPNLGGFSSVNSNREPLSNFQRDSSPPSNSNNYTSYRSNPQPTVNDTTTQRAGNAPTKGKFFSKNDNFESIFNNRHLL